MATGSDIHNLERGQYSHIIKMHLISENLLYFYIQLRITRGMLWKSMKPST